VGGHFLDYRKELMPAGISISPPVATISPLERAEKLLSDSADKIQKLTTESACSDAKEDKFFEQFPFEYEESNLSWIHADWNVDMSGLSPEDGNDENGFDAFGVKDGKLKNGYPPGGTKFTKDCSWSESFSPSDRPPQ
jgi:hypothetical protein